jgi:hypothetical protein
VFAHEAAATLPMLAALMVWQLGSPQARRDWRWPGLGYAAVLVIFAAAALSANRDNYVFRDGHYAIGVHMVENAADYLVSLWMGPHVGWAYLVTAGIVAALAAMPGLTRFGAVWMLVVIVPYLGFTWANAGRYTYLPAMGFGLALGGALGAAFDAARDGRRRWQSRLAIVIAVIVAARFAVFTLGGARGDLASFEPARQYIAGVKAGGAQPVDGVLTVPAPVDPLVDVRYVEVMLRWAYRQPLLEVVVR